MGILGTRFLMEGPVYSSRLASADIDYRVPNPRQRELTNQIKSDNLAQIIYGELRYLDEQAFRYNERKTDDRSRFARTLSQVVGRRLTFKELTGKTDGPDSLL